MTYVSHLSPFLITVLGKMKHPELLPGGHIFPVDFDATGVDFPVAFGADADGVAVVVGSAIGPFENTMHVEEVVVVLPAKVTDLFDQLLDLLP
jgi:hypothetical protein